MWSDTPPECVIKQNNSVCQKPQTVPNAYYSVYGSGSGRLLNKGGIFSEGTSVVYVCETGYKLFGDRSRMCIGDNKWTGVAPSCVPGCSTPPKVPNAKYSFFGTAGGTSKSGNSSLERIADDSAIYYFCDHGYRYILIIIISRLQINDFLNKNESNA